METFGQIVRRHLAEHAGMSLRELAKRAHLDPGHLSRVVRDLRRPSDEVAAALDNALCADGELRRAAEALRAAEVSVASVWSTPSVRSGWAYQDIALPDDPFLREVMIPVDRREFLLASAAALTTGRTAPRHVDPALVGYFNEQLEGHYRADMMLGPHDLIATVSAQYQLIDRLSRASAGRTRKGLLGVGVAYAALVGWLYQDAGDVSAALFWRGITQEVAHRCGDPNLIGYALNNYASIRTDLGDGEGVMELCSAALRGTQKHSPKLRVMTLQQQAHGASLLGDRALVDKLLDEAAPLVDQVDDELPWGNACRRTPGYIEVQRATCYGRLGLGQEAADLWAQTIGQTPQAAHRDVGVYLARRATACATAHHPDQAVDVARSAVRIAQETGSARVCRELRTLNTSMRPWQSAAVGQQMTDVLAPIMEGTAG